MLAFTMTDPNINRPRWYWLLVLCSIAALMWMMSVRIFGPSDAWDQDQPKTMGYTVDISQNGRWILPMERGVVKASKPPLYNWIAVPAVRVGGYSSELAQKFPSVLSFMVCVAALILVGRRIEMSRWAIVGWLAVMMLVSHYAMFKLSYTARPDMVLTACLMLGWVLATLIIIRSRNKAAAEPASMGSPEIDTLRDNTADWMPTSILCLLFWICVGLAALAKGPPAAVLMLYALIGSRVMAGTWRSAASFQWLWGLPLAVAMFGAWIFGVYLIDPEHLYQRLWFDEVFGRVTGMSDQGNSEGPREFVRKLFHMPLYFMARFLPWSIPALLGIITVIHQRKAAVGRRHCPWIAGSVIAILITIGFFSLSTGKRADYIAFSYLPGSLVAAWWLVYMSPSWLQARLWLAPLAAAVSLSLMTYYDAKHLHAPAPGFGDHIISFVHQTNDHVRAEPRPLLFWNGGSTHLQGFLGNSEPERHEEMLDRIRQGEALWVIGGRDSSLTFPQWLEANDFEPALQVVLSKPEPPLLQVALYKVN